VTQTSILRQSIRSISYNYNSILLNQTEAICNKNRDVIFIDFRKENESNNSNKNPNKIIK